MEASHAIHLLLAVGGGGGNGGECQADNAKHNNPLVLFKQIVFDQVIIPNLEKLKVIEVCNALHLCSKLFVFGTGTTTATTKINDFKSELGNGNGKPLENKCVLPSSIIDSICCCRGGCCCCFRLLIAELGKDDAKVEMASALDTPLSVE